MVNNSFHCKPLTWRLTGSKGESIVAELTILFTRISQPLDQTFLMNEFDAPCTDAGVEKWSVVCSFTPAHTTNIYIVEKLN